MFIPEVDTGYLSCHGAEYDSNAALFNAIISASMNVSVNVWINEEDYMQLK